MTAASALPLVSIVIPSYNHSAFVQDCIRSILAQDYDNIELIIIDDGSRDDSVAKIQEMVAACQQRFVRFEFRHRPNRGLCRTLNEALDWAEGTYFCPFASDDMALPEKTSFLVSHIQNTAYLAVFGKTVGIGETAKPRTLKDTTIHSFAQLIRHRDMPATPTALIRTHAIRQLGGYEPSVKMEDWYMWLKLTEQGASLASFPKVVATYRRHNSNITNNRALIQAERRRIVDLFQHSAHYQAALDALELIAARDHEKTDKIKAWQHLRNYGLWRSKAWPTMLKLLRH